MADRSVRDIDVQPVRVHKSMGTVTTALLACSACNVMPTDDEGHLMLELVRTPDRRGTDHENLFLGPVCKEREIKRYINGIAPQ